MGAGIGDDNWMKIEGVVGNSGHTMRVGLGDDKNGMIIEGGGGGKE